MFLNGYQGRSDSALRVSEWTIREPHCLQMEREKDPLPFFRDTLMARRRYGKKGNNSNVLHVLESFKGKVSIIGVRDGEWLSGNFSCVGKE